MKRNTFTLSPGSPSQLGAHVHHDSVCFSLFSEHATGVSLCLFELQEQEPFTEIALDPHIHRTGFIWHITVQGVDLPLKYGYRVTGPKNSFSDFDPTILLSDPYAIALNTSHQWGIKHKAPVLGVIQKKTSFDWEDDTFPNIPMQDLIIYEMQVRSFSRYSAQFPGTFLGVLDKIPYLKSLGINAIELMPIFEFDECQMTQKNPETGDLLLNVWGYLTINFFCPMNRFGVRETLNELRALVKECHKQGIEVYLDVVYNHTADSRETNTSFSFRGIDNQVYYILSPEGAYLNYSGTGNTLNCNHPVVTQLILDSLRYWVTEAHIDGFRFDLASILTRDEQGEPLTHPPVIEAITRDPLLSHVKLIAEAWDAGGLYQVGNFPSYGRWCEWNGQFRDTVRRFMKGSDGIVGNFAQVMTGSEHLYKNNRKPYHSINFITAHDGFSLRDLVTYQNKSNWANGENNQDGANDNESWNCGVEGVSSDPRIIQLRARQMRNFITALFVAIGTPMVVMGDEYGHTRKGNNNTWCQDNDFNNFLWDELKHNEAWFRFYQLMILFRKDNPLLRRTDFLTEREVLWHGWEPLKVNWGPESRFLAYTLKDPSENSDLYIAFNMHFHQATIHFPAPPTNKQWYRVVDTALESPNDFIEEPLSTHPIASTYIMRDHSVLVLKSF